MKITDERVYAIPLLIVLISLFSIWLMGCSVRMYPICNTDEQVEMMRRIAIDSYKQGLIDMATAEEQLRPWEVQQSGDTPKEFKF